MAIDWVQGWIWAISDVVPPFCVEVFFVDGRRHYLHSIVDKDDDTNTGVLRIWDLRAFKDDELEDLKLRLNEIIHPEDLQREQEVHPKLDWANVYVKKTDIAYCIEWHDRLWPEDDRPRIGFSDP